MVDTNSKVPLPRGSDRELLSKLLPEANKLRVARNQEDHDRLVKRAEDGLAASRIMGKQLNLDEQQVGLAFKSQQQRFREVAKKKLPPRPPRRGGHNPVRWAPFDMPWSWASAGGLDYLSLYGPDASSGEIGADLGFLTPGGSASAVTSVGFWYFSQADGSLLVEASAEVSGVGYAFSALFGWASASASQRTYVEEYTSNGVNVFQSSTSIYNQGSLLVADLSPTGWETVNSGLVVPVQPNTWYAIWTDLVESVGGGGIADAVTNFEGFVDSVSYQLL